MRRRQGARKPVSKNTLSKMERHYMKINKKDRQLVNESMLQDMKRDDVNYFGMIDFGCHRYWRDIRDLFDSNEDYSDNFPTLLEQGAPVAIIGPYIPESYGAYQYTFQDFYNYFIAERQRNITVIPLPDQKVKCQQTYKEGVHYAEYKGVMSYIDFPRNRTYYSGSMFRTGAQEADTLRFVGSRFPTSEQVDVVKLLRGEDSNSNEPVNTVKECESEYVKYIPGNSPNANMLAAYTPGVAIDHHSGSKNSELQTFSLVVDGETFTPDNSWVAFNNWDGLGFYQSNLKGKHAKITMTNNLISQSAEAEALHMWEENFLRNAMFSFIPFASDYVKEDPRYLLCEDFRWEYKRTSIDDQQIAPGEIYTRAIKGHEGVGYLPGYQYDRTFNETETTTTIKGTFRECYSQQSTVALPLTITLYGMYNGQEYVLSRKIITTHLRNCLAAVQKIQEISEDEPTESSSNAAGDPQRYVECDFDLCNLPREMYEIEDYVNRVYFTIDKTSGGLFIRQVYNRGYLPKTIGEATLPRATTAVKRISSKQTRASMYYSYGSNNEDQEENK